MSKLIQKTLHSLNSVLNSSGYLEKDKLLGLRNLSIVAFQEKLKNTGTKHEEEEVVTDYLKKVEKRLSEPDVSCTEVEEMVKICMVCETMGYKAEFVYVHCLKLAQKGNLQQKHTGYLAVEFFLHPNHELVILLINTLQKDLNSSNHLEVMLALTAICHLINSETVHSVLHLVEDRLHHPVPCVRKCAILTLSHCLQLLDSESSYQMAFPKLKNCLGDPELEVVSVVIPTLRRVIEKLGGDFSSLLDSLLHLLDQILMRRIPQSMNYSDIPAPWLQIEILKLVKHLCASSDHCEKLASVLKKTLTQTGLYHVIAQAVVYQVVEVVACIDSDRELLEVALSSASLLLKSKDVNMKFMGLEALVLLVRKSEPSIAVTQQEMVIDCLNFPDESLQLKALELLYHLANTANVQAICSKMLDFLDHVKDQGMKKNLANKILELAKKHKNRHQWYISIVNAVLVKMDQWMTSADICKIVDVITQDSELKQIAKQEFGKHIIDQNGRVIPSILKIYVSTLAEPGEFITVLQHLEKAEEDAASWALISLMESILKHKSLPTPCVDALKKLQDKFNGSYCVDIILKQIYQTINVIDDMHKLDACTKVDPSLTSLDGYVLEFLQNSESVFETCSLRMSDDRLSFGTTDLSCESFDCPSTGETSSHTSFAIKSPVYSTLDSPSISFHSFSSEAEASTPTVRKTAVWTKDGRSKKTQVKEETKEEELLQLFAGIKN